MLNKPQMQNRRGVIALRTRIQYAKTHKKTPMPKTQFKNPQNNSEL